MDTPSLLHLDNCLRLLDSCLLGSWSISGDEMAVQEKALESLREGNFTAALMALCISCNIVLNDGILEEHIPAGISDTVVLPTLSLTSCV